MPHIDARVAGSGTRMSCLALVTVLGLTACGTGSGDSASAVPPGETVTNCDIQVPVGDPPERVFAAYQPAIEMAHALGIGDRLVGTAYLDAQVLPGYVDAQAEQTYYENLPSREELLSLEPDFLLSGFNDIFFEGGDADYGSRASLRELGIESWIFSPLCPSADGMGDEAIDPATVTMENVYADVRDLGRVFGVSERAEEVVAELEADVAEVTEAVADAEDTPTVMIGRPGDDGSFRASGGPDFGTVVLDLAGGENVFADLDGKRNHEVGAEEIIARDPDYILVNDCCSADLTAADAAPLVERIMTDPALANLTAVREEQVLGFTFADHSAGVRGPHAVRLVASLIHPDLVEGDQP